MKAQKVPVFMHHTVGEVNHDWLWPHLTCPWKLFENHLIWMKRFNIETISLQQLYDHKKNNADLPSRSVVLTFDDGYLDNWVFAYPLLKKYGFNAVIYVNPEFVDSANTVRKNLEDVWGNNILLEDLETKGFLSWKEMEIMESEGVIDIQSHSMSHTWYFCSDKIVDFHHPGNKKHPWLFWNARPESKCRYFHENQENFVPYGTPVYEHGRSLGIKKYNESEHLNEFLADFVKDRGIDFFKGVQWKSELFNQVKLYLSEDSLKGSYETAEEQKQRYSYELGNSKEILEQRLNKKVEFLCWPGGANNDISTKICFDQGYKAYTVSAHKNMGVNNYLEDPSVFFRIGAPNVQHKGKMIYLGGIGFVLRYFSFKGSIIAKVMQKCLRLIVKILVDLKIIKDGAYIQ